MSNWHDFKDVLPPIDKTVLVYLDGTPFLGKVDSNHKLQLQSYTPQGVPLNPIFWDFLPDPPK